MNEQHFSNDKNHQHQQQVLKFNNLELSSDFRAIINIATKSLKAPISLVALVHDDGLLISTNHKPLDGKTVNHKETIFKQSLSLATLRAQNVFIKEISEQTTIKSYASSALFSKTGKIIGFLAIIDNNLRKFSTDEMSLLEDFSKITTGIIEKHLAEKKLKEVFTDFVHKTVHDLKNPFTTISLTTELLKRKADDANLVMSFSQRLENANNKVFKNLERLKSAFPINNDGFKLNIQEINSNDLLLEVQQQINNEIIIDNQLAEKIYGDHHRLVEAVVQLITHLFLLSESPQQFTLKAYIKENEAIIEVSNAVNSNENFTDLEETTNSTALSIAKKLVEMHYGKITAAHHKASDSYRFYISLPLTTL